MVSKIVCVMLLLFQNRRAVLISDDSPIPGPVIARRIITATIFIILIRINIIPERFRRFMVPHVVHLIEFSFSVLLMEFLRNGIWSRIEQLIDRAYIRILVENDLELGDTMNEYWLPNIFKVAVSCLIFMMVAALRSLYVR